MSDIIEALCEADSTSLRLKVEELIQKYREGQLRAPLLTLVQVMTIASGTPNVEIKPDDVASGVDVSAVLENLYSYVLPESSAYLLANKEVKYKKFPQRFDDMWQFFIKSSLSADVLFEDSMLPSIALWLVSMSESKCRSFRHTSTAAAMSIIQGLNELHENLKARLGFVREPEEMIRVKGNIEPIIEWRDHLFSQVVHPRLRDVAIEIRLVCIQQLKRWMLEFSDEFMEKQYLRYFGMSFHEKRPQLRIEALEMILLSLGRVNGAFERIKLFIDYFLKRIVEMSSDVDAKCAELSLRVLAMIVKCASESSQAVDDVINSEMIDAALRALFDERPSVRAAAGVLLHVFVYARCNGEEEEDSEQLASAAELVGSFAGILRLQYKENMAEKYIVDSLWTGGMPPALLTESKLINDLSMSENSEEVVIGLSFLSAVLQKLQNELVLGPQPKDDRRTPTVKLNGSKKEKLEDLTNKLSSDGANILSKVIGKFSSNKAVLCCSANLLYSMDFCSLTSSDDQLSMSAALKDFLHAMFSVTLDRSELNAVIPAWLSLLGKSHPFHTEAEASLHEMRQRILKELSQLSMKSKKSSDKQRLEEVYAAVSSRCCLLASLTSVPEMISQMEVTFKPYLNIGSTKLPVATLRIIEAMFKQLLWEVNGNTGSDLANNDVIKDNVRRLVGICLTAEHTKDGFDWSDEWMIQLMAKSVTTLCDLIALNLCTLSDSIQTQLFVLFENTLQGVSQLYLNSQEEHREAQTMKAESVQQLHEQLQTSREQMFRWDALQLSLVEGLGRLFMLQKLPLTASPEFIFFWVRASSKSISNFFKQCFHTLRDISQENFFLEKEVLMVAYNRCVKVGATPISVEEMCQLGTKLSSLYFGSAVDRYYSSCVSMVEHAIEFASTVDPLLLQAVIPYCSKLKLPEALHFLRKELPSREIFKTAAHPHVRSFIGALCRVAKVNDATASTNQRKRQRELNEIVQHSQPEDALSELVESVQSLRNHGAAIDSLASRSANREGRQIFPVEPSMSSQTSSDGPLPSQPNYSELAPRPNFSLLSSSNETL